MNDSWTEILMKNGVLTIFKLYFAEFMKELIRPFGVEAPNQYLPQPLPKKCSQIQEQKRKVYYNQKTAKL